MDRTLSAPKDRDWRHLRLIGGIAALMAAVVFRRWLSAELEMLQGLGIIHFDSPLTPGTPMEWFTLLHTNRFIGLILLNFFDVVNYVLAAMMYMGIYSLLRNHDKAFVRLAVILTVAGTSMYLVSNQALNLLSLSNRYFLSDTEAQKTLVLSAGQFALTINDPVAFGTGTFWSYMLLYAAGLILSIIMLRTAVIARWIGILGIVANSFGLGYFVTSMINPSLGVIPALGSAPTNLIWYFALGIHLIRNAYIKAEK